MNRVRKHGNSFQVLITPTKKFDSDVSFMVGNWIDPDFGGFRVVSYRTFREAMMEASKYPNLDWDQLILWNVENYRKFYGIINRILDMHQFDVKLDAHLMNSYQVKDAMFDRISILKNNFRLSYHMSDIILFTISRFRNVSIRTLAAIFSENQALRIIYKITDREGIKLVGQTDLGVSYMISLKK